jgi:hypothetical protein
VLLFDLLYPSFSGKIFGAGIEKEVWRKTLMDRALEV